MGPGQRGGQEDGVLGANISPGVTFGPRVPHCCCAWPKPLSRCSWDAQAPHGSACLYQGNGPRGLLCLPSLLHRLRPSPSDPREGSSLSPLPRPGRASADIPQVGMGGEGQKLPSHRRPNHSFSFLSFHLNLGRQGKVVSLLSGCSPPNRPEVALFPAWGSAKIRSEGGQGRNDSTASAHTALHSRELFTLGQARGKSRSAWRPRGPLLLRI